MSARPLIAVVDDDLSVRQALGRLLSLEGFEIGLFASGSELLDSLAVGSAVCFVLDIHLDGSDGFEICRSLRERGAGALVIFMTGRDSEATRTRAATFSRTAYLRKPFDEDALLELIRGATPAADEAQDAGPSALKPPA